MHVERAASVIALGDAGGLQVPVEDPHQRPWHVEDPGIGGQTGRDRREQPEPGISLERGEPLNEPGPEVVRQIGPDRHGVAFPGLLVGRVEVDVRNRTVEPELSDGQGRQLTLAKFGSEPGSCRSTLAPYRALRVVPWLPE
jgi:hypothetical protein